MTGVRFGTKKSKRDKIYPSLIALANVNFFNHQLSIAQNVMYFLAKINMNDDDIENITVQTSNQSENPIWYEQRKARITASNFYHVLTCS